MRTPLLAIIGPTASGKSDISLCLAQQFQGEIVNCDSIQIYKFLEIGTSKVLREEQRGIPHHLMDLFDPNQRFTAGQYMFEGRKVLNEIKSRGNLPLVVGGTGLYLRALLNGLFEGPAQSESLRARLQQRKVSHLHQLLKKVDRDSAQRISPRDQPKIIRALEVFFLTSKTLSSHFQTPTQKLEDFQPIKVGLSPPRDKLYDRIEDRVDRMFSGGLIEEVKSILNKGFSSNCKPLQSIGYAQSVSFLKGIISLSEAITSTKQATRKYAKRQLTWFRKEKDVTWFNGFGHEEKIENQIKNYLGQFT